MRLTHRRPVNRLARLQAATCLAYSRFSAHLDRMCGWNFQVVASTAGIWATILSVPAEEIVTKRTLWAHYMLTHECVHDRRQFERAARRLA